MHRREMNKFAAQALEKGNTLVPLKMYFKEGRAKVLLGICKGKQQHDKRQVAEAARQQARDRSGDAAEESKQAHSLVSCYWIVPQSPPPPPGPSRCGSAS